MPDIHELCTDKDNNLQENDIVAKLCRLGGSGSFLVTIMWWNSKGHPPPTASYL